MPKRAHHWRVDAALQARVCRAMAVDLRAEHAAGDPPIKLRTTVGRRLDLITRLEAAVRLDRQADRWQAEADTGVPNLFDRARIGA